MGQQYIGERFGDYKLVRPLGEGGFASVYLGQEVHKGTLAAIKLPKEQQVHDFINEVRRTFRLRNPNIIEILDFGIKTPDNKAFIIMEYAPNGSFRDKYPRGTRVPLNVIVTSVKQVASALQYAHDQRVIHRDVKPENLLLNARNMALLSDFGIATASRTAMTAYAGQAGQGDIIGTYAYMAPEQLKGRPVPASDQYSLAIMVYEWLCGEVPFEAREYIQWLYLHEREAPLSLRDHVPSLVPAVEQVVLRALAKKPEERFERVETFASALERAARGEDVSSVMSASGPTKHATQFDSVPLGKQANNLARTPSNAIERLFQEGVRAQSSGNADGPTKHATQFDSASVGKQANDLARTPSNAIEQLFQEGVRAQSNGNAEEAFRIWRQMMTTSGVAERYSTTARNRIRELRTQMIPLRLKQAREASVQGRYQDEIRLWEDVLALEPSAQDLAPLFKSPLTLGKPASNITQSIQQRLQIAQQNEQSAWMYTGAQQFIHNRDNAAARTQLQMLWHDAPYYGDPAGLAQAIGLPIALNYEQAIAAEQVRLERERERQERERQEQERLVRERQEQVLAKQKRNNRILLIIMGAVVLLGVAGGAVAGGVAGGVAVAAGVMAGVMAGEVILGEGVLVVAGIVTSAVVVAIAAAAGVAAGAGVVAVVAVVTAAIAAVGAEAGVGVGVGIAAVVVVEKIRKDS